MQGNCSQCGGLIVEARGRRTGNNSFLRDEQGPLIKTKCGQCGRFFGYRPVEDDKESRRRRKH